MSTTAIWKAGVGDVIDGGGGFPLVVAEIVRRPRDGDIPMDDVYLIATDDGGGYEAVWHSGPRAEEDVYVERWNQLGFREFHGWIDKTSRKLVQTG